MLRSVQSPTDPISRHKDEILQQRASIEKQKDSNQAQVNETATRGEESLLDRFLGRKTVVYKGHTIEIKRTYSGTEIVLYDGEQVSSKMSIFRPTHSFQIVEDNERVQYTVMMRPRMMTLGMSLWFEVKRNGMIIFSDRQSATGENISSSMRYLPIGDPH